MTVPPKDQPAMWFKQVPDNSPNAEGVWSQTLIDNHHTVARSYDRPTVTVDAVAYQELKVAAEIALFGESLRDPKFKRLHDALLADDRVNGERR